MSKRLSNVDHIHRRPPTLKESALAASRAFSGGSFEATPGSEKYAQLAEVLRVFFEGGGRVFDTSPNYSGADEVLGALLAEGGMPEDPAAYVKRVNALLV